MSKGGGTVETSSGPDPRYNDFIDGNLALAGTMANSPYVAYQGDQTADFTGDQMAAFQNIRSMAAQGPQDLGYGVASDVANTGVQQVTQNATDEIMRANAMANRGVNSAASMSGAYGGARHTLLNAENNRNAMGQVGRSAAEIGFQGQGLRLGAAGQMMQSGMGQTNQALTLNNALAGVGQQQQGLNQADLNTNYGQFLDEQNYPLRMLSLRQSAIGQTPMGTVSRQPTQSQSMLPSILSAGAQLGSAAILCWVAREAYGADNPKWLSFREWMMREAPVWLFRLYVKHGPAFAKWLRDKPIMRASVRFVMDRILEVANARASR